MLDFDALISPRARAVQPSGIRRVFELASKMRDPIDLSIGQPDFTVPKTVRRAAIDAIEAGHNGYTLTSGIPALRAAVQERLAGEVGWSFDTAGAWASSQCEKDRRQRAGSPCSRRDGQSVLITSGTSAGLFLAAYAFTGPGDEIVMPDPWFVLYPQLANMTGATARHCDTYPDFRLTAARLEPLLTPQTKIVLLNSPANPTGVVLSADEMREIVELCVARGVLIVSDEIYDEFVFGEQASRHQGIKASRHGGDDPLLDASMPRCLDASSFSSAARYSDQVIILRGFGKTWGVTGWRLGYAAGPKRLLDEMAKIHQYAYVCAPSIAQHAGIVALKTDMSETVARYAKRRDMVLDALAPVTQVSRPAGAFYAFPEVPPRLGISATEFAARAAEREVLVVPGCVFSQRDTHFRLSYAVEESRLKRGLDVLVELMK